MSKATGSEMKREWYHMYFILINLIALLPSGSANSANVDVTFTFSISDLVPFDSINLLDAMNAYNTSLFKSLVQRNTFRLVDTAVVICIDGECVDESNMTIPHQATPTPAPTADNKAGLSTAVITVVVSGCVLVLVIAIVVFIRLSKLSSSTWTSKIESKSGSNPQINSNQPSINTKKLLQVEIDWPPKNTHPTKTGFKITERYHV